MNRFWSEQSDESRLTWVVRLLLWTLIVLSLSVRYCQCSDVYRENLEMSKERPKPEATASTVTGRIVAVFGQPKELVIEARAVPGKLTIYGGVLYKATHGQLVRITFEPIDETDEPDE